MTDIVLVPGGWRGGWTFSSIARDIRARGHEAWTPTLTGLGERVHLARGPVNLDTHIDDIANVLLYEQLTQVTLCGYSYATLAVSLILLRLFVRAFVLRADAAWRVVSLPTGHNVIQEAPGDFLSIVIA